MNKLGKTTLPRNVYKPIQFEWAIDALETQHRMHWIPNEIDLLSDVKEFSSKLNDHERSLIINILRFFTQSDLEVARAYIDYYLKVFKCPEIRMMLASFASMETIHILSYSFLITSLRLPDSEYSAFLKYKEMSDKYDYMQSFDPQDPQTIATTMAVFSGGIEGLALFSSFAVLMYFPIRRAEFSESALHGVGQIISFSIRDESLHTMSMIKLFHVYIEENKDSIDKEQLHKDIYAHFEKIVSMESVFIDLVFENGDLPGLSRDDLKKYIYYLADLRLKQLGLKPIYGYETNPLEWTNSFLFPQELANFFELTPTNYTKGDFINNVEFDYDSF